MKRLVPVLALSLLLVGGVVGCNNTPAGGTQTGSTQTVASAETPKDATPEAGTETEGLPVSYENLKAAVQGETTAKEKYVQFAAKAKEEGKLNAAKLYTAAPDAEDIHIGKEYDLSNAMQAYDKPAPDNVEVLTTEENLQSCVDGENYEATEMYPNFLAISDEECLTDVSQIFTYARDAEASHAVLFEEELKRLNDGGDIAEVKDYYLCPICGKIEVGSAPTACSVCGVSGDQFIKY